jgi:hypothetical protein
MTKHTAREAWLRQAAKLMQARFDEIECPVPSDYHVSVGFKPAGGYESALVMGCCYIRAASSAKVNEIFISPEWDDPIEILATFAHELIHAASDCQDGHGPGFKKHAVAFGLTGKMTATYASEDLAKYLKTIAGKLGPYPHAKTVIFANKRKRLLNPTAPEPTPGDPGEGGGKIHSGRGKQGTAMLKLICDNPTCGFIARTTAKNLDMGMPICACGTPLSCPQYAEVLIERWYMPHPHWGYNGPRPDRYIEAEVKEMEESLVRRREWSRARGYLPAAVATVTKTVRKAVKPKLPAKAVKAMAELRKLAEWVEPYPATLGEAERYPDDALDVWETAESLAGTVQELDDALAEILPA